MNVANWMSLVSVLFGSLFCVQDMADSRPIRNSGIAVNSWEDSFRMVELTHVAGKDQLIVGDLMGDLRLVRGKAPTTLIDLKSQIAPEYDQQLGFLDRGDRGWSIACGFHKGGGRGMNYWWSDGQLTTGTRSTQIDFIQVMDVVLIKSESFFVPEELVPRGSTLDDLNGFQLIESPSGVHVLACGERVMSTVDNHDRKNGGIIWIAKMPKGSDTRQTPTTRRNVRMFLVGTRIMEGSQPKVVQLVDSHLLAVRACRQYQRESAPLRFYRSSDLLKWELDPRYSEGASAGATYAVTVDGPRLWLADFLVHEGNYRVRLLQLDLASGRWGEERFIDSEIKHGAPDRMPLVWVLPGESTKMPTIIMKTMNGTLHMLRK